MLNKIPRRLTAPFGLLGDEAKLAFPTQPGGVAKLAAVRVSDAPQTLLKPHERWLPEYPRKRPLLEPSQHDFRPDTIYM